MAATTAVAGLDKRHHARYSVALPVTVKGLPLSTQNVSLCGMQLSCPSMNYRLLAADVKAGELTIDVELPEHGRFQADARVIYASEYDDEHLLGVHLTHFENGGFALFEHFIEGLATRKPAA